MKPGDLVFWEDTKFFHHRLWRIESVLLGGERQESLVRLTSLLYSPGEDEDGNHQQTVLVPECLIRDIVFTRAGRA